MGFLSFLAPIAGSLVSGLFGNKKASKEERINQQNLEEQRRVNAENRGYAVQDRDLSHQWAIDAENRATARDAARVQTVVADAKKAGIHPLAALGASGLSGGIVTGGQQAVFSSPSSAAAVRTYTPSSSGIGDSIGAAIAQFGQLENQQLQNSLLKAQIANLNAETLATATSRTLIADARSASQGGRGSVSSRIAGQPNTWGKNTATAADIYARQGQGITGMAMVEANNLREAIRQMASSISSGEFWRFPTRDGRGVNPWSAMNKYATRSPSQRDAVSRMLNNPRRLRYK